MNFRRFAKNGRVPSEMSSDSKFKHLPGENIRRITQEKNGLSLRDRKGSRKKAFTRNFRCSSRDDLSNSSKFEDRDEPHYN